MTACAPCTDFPTDMLTGEQLDVLRNLGLLRDGGGAEEAEGGQRRSARTMAPDEDQEAAEAAAARASKEHVFNPSQHLAALKPTPDEIFRKCSANRIQREASPRRAVGLSAARCCEGLNTCSWRRAPRRLGRLLVFVGGHGARAAPLPPSASSAPPPSRSSPRLRSTSSCSPVSMSVGKSVHGHTLSWGVGAKCGCAGASPGVGVAGRRLGLARGPVGGARGAQGRGARLAAAARARRQQAKEARSAPAGSSLRDGAAAAAPASTPTAAGRAPRVRGGGRGRLLATAERARPTRGDGCRN
ncbi:Protein of unknown function [Gryllus bimaculatus]|nr:Protein of unknown function [Gryllus bimaculatus]